jgi:hypothetical protein
VQAEGVLKEKLVRALDAIASGTCPADLMSPLLLDACEKQLPQMQARLTSLGSIKEAQFRGIEQFPNGLEAEAYKVVFEKGALTWFVGAAPNGKLNTLWSPP